jgi:hypothetical protein
MLILLVLLPHACREHTGFASRAHALSLHHFRRSCLNVKGRTRKEKQVKSNHSSLPLLLPAWRTVAEQDLRKRVATMSHSMLELEHCCRAWSTGLTRG